MGAAVPAHKAFGWAWEKIHGNRIVGFLAPWIGDLRCFGSGSLRFCGRGELDDRVGGFGYCFAGAGDVCGSVVGC